MAVQGEHKENEKLCDSLHQLLYEVGRLRLQMRNNNNSMISEILFTPSAVVDPKSAEPLRLLSEDANPKDLETECFTDSSADVTLTEAINRLEERDSSNKDCTAVEYYENPVKQMLLSSKFSKKLQKLNADLDKILNEMRCEYEESFSQIIQSS